MARTTGAKNVTLFSQRTRLETSGTEAVAHFAKKIATGTTSLERFKYTISHQRSFLAWIDSRHSKLKDASEQISCLTSGSDRGPKDATFSKYQWYASQLVLLEAINSLEVFYKHTFVDLGTALRLYVKPESLKGTVDSKVLWFASPATNPVALVFESSLFHSLETIDDVCNMLVGKRYYMPKNRSSRNYNSARKLKIIFQIRHTLSHNAGKVTESDRSKFGALGFESAANEIVDPKKDNFGDSVLRFMEAEAAAFTKWLREKTAEYLQVCISEGMTVPAANRSSFELALGSDATIWDSIGWT